MYGKKKIHKREADNHVVDCRKGLVKEQWVFLDWFQLRKGSEPMVSSTLDSWNTLLSSAGVNRIYVITHAYLQVKEISVGIHNSKSLTLTSSLKFPWKNLEFTNRGIHRPLLTEKKVNEMTSLRWEMFIRKSSNTHGIDVATFVQICETMVMYDKALCNQTVIARGTKRKFMTSDYLCFTFFLLKQFSG